MVRLMLFTRPSKAYLDNIGSPGILGADAGNGDSFAKSLDELVLQRIHLLEVGVEVRHLGKCFIEVGPGGVRNAIRRVLVKAAWSCSESMSGQ
jgi:hypothetical protein